MLSFIRTLLILRADLHPPASQTRKEEKKVTERPIENLKTRNFMTLSTCIPNLSKVHYLNCRCRTSEVYVPYSMSLYVGIKDKLP